jgi:hypothetical protein
VRKPPSASIQPLLHQDSNGTSTRWLIETGYLRLQAESVADLGAGWSPRGAVIMAHRRVDMPWHSPIQPPAMGQIMTEDGGEQPMWRLIGSSRTPRHMAE